MPKRFNWWAADKAARLMDLVFSALSPTPVTGGVVSKVTVVLDFDKKPNSRN
jgi:hypothetical protein